MLDRRHAIAASAIATASLLLSGCGGSSSTTSTTSAAGTTTSAAASTGSTEKMTLTINVFGDSFPKSVYDAYTAAHPNITIKENRADYGAHHNNLQAHLAAGSGTADIEVIEIGQIAGYLGQGEKFVNFNDQGVDPAQWSPAKIKQATATDGSLVGLGTDIGGLAICYRADLFKAAGLPTDREEVGKLWPTWEDYVKVGSDFIAKTPDKKVKWYDGAGHVMTGILAQEKNTFYDDQGEVIAGTNPVVKQAWDLSVTSIQAKQSAALAEFSPEWNTGFQQGQFATITCPAWMTAYIRNNAPETKGKWDIATVPGGSGNWGGSFLTVPKAGKHTAEAVDLAKYLTTPDTAVKVFKEFGNYPSPVKTWDLPEVEDAKDAFFSDAPVGVIFPKSFANLPEQAAGPQSGVIGVALNTALNQVEQGEDPTTAWEKALKDIEAAAG